MEEEDKEEDEAGEDEEVEDVNDNDKPEELDMVGSIINGNIDIEVPSQIRLVRIFTSSTFTGRYFRLTLVGAVIAKKIFNI